MDQSESIDWTTASRPIVMVSGCYDLLHSGHVAFFADAAQHGNLYVSVSHDSVAFCCCCWWCCCWWWLYLCRYYLKKGILRTKALFESEFRILSAFRSLRKSDSLWIFFSFLVSCLSLLSLVPVSCPCLLSLVSCLLSLVSCVEGIIIYIQIIIILIII